MQNRHLLPRIYPAAWRRNADQSRVRAQQCDKHDAAPDRNWHRRFHIHPPFFIDFPHFPYASSWWSLVCLCRITLERQLHTSAACNNVCRRHHSRRKRMCGLCGMMRNFFFFFHSVSKLSILTHCCVVLQLQHTPFRRSAWATATHQCPRPIHFSWSECSEYNGMSVRRLVALGRWQLNFMNVSAFADFLTKLRDKPQKNT